MQLLVAFAQFGPDARVYRVGGAVRDTLLSHPYTETDWVVVGTTPDALLDAGFKQVGADFPVFLHPTTSEEYALARTERKSGQGYHGFTVHATPTVTLEEDLLRRDLTINAMAMDEHNNLIDPYGGARDLNSKTLRHVSASFSEDPLRVLRTCRFAARYHHLGFTVAAETMQLMQGLVSSGALSELAPERLWRETERALREKSPHIYFQLISALGAEPGVFPCQFSKASQLGLELVSKVHDASLHRWAGLVAPALHGQATSRQYIMTVPKQFQQLSERVAICLGNPPETAESALAFMEHFDGFRQGSQLEEGLQVLACIDPLYNATQIARLREVHATALGISGAVFRDQGLVGTDIKKALNAERLARISSIF